jgi:transposase
MTDSDGEEERVLRTDALGRVRTSAERREAVLDEFERSGLSGPKFAEVCGINYQTFSTWRQKRKRERGEYPKKRTEATNAVPTFSLVEALPMAEAKHDAATGLEVVLPCGATLKIEDEKQVALAAVLIRTLGGAK